MSVTYESVSRTRGRERTPQVMRRDLPDPDALVMPAGVAKLHREAVEAIDRYEAARAAAAAAREAAEKAPRADATADAAAVQAGRPLPQPTVSVREREAEEATRMVAAAAVNAETLIDRFFSELGSEGSRVRADQEAHIAALRDEVTKLLDAVDVGLARLHAACGALLTTRSGDRRWGKRSGASGHDRDDALHLLRTHAVALSHDAAFADIDVNAAGVVRQPVGGTRHG